MQSQPRRGPKFGTRTFPLIAGILLLAVLAETQDGTKSVSGAALPPARAAAVWDQARGLDYVISPEDILEVSVLDVPELSSSYRVSPSGTVTLPLVTNPITAAGRTLPEFSGAVAEELKSLGLVSQPHVSASVKQSRLHAVTITGAVRKPQIFPVYGRTTLLDVLSQAEGLADDASNGAIVRRGDLAIQALTLDKNKDLAGEQLETARTVTVDLKRVLESGDPSVNMAIYPGDRITVPKAGLVYVVGAVNRPGGFTMKPGKLGMTVLQAVALAEDVKSTALRDQAVIIRTDAGAADGRRQIPVDLKKVLSGKQPDPILQADDILFVPDSPGKRAFRRGIEAVLQTATGVAIYRR